MYNKRYLNISNEVLICLQENKIKYNIKSESFDIEEKFSMRMLTLLNFFEKLVSEKKRKVHLSKELKAKIKVNEEIRDKVKMFQHKFEKGEDVNSNLSKLIFKGNHWDNILNSWNIKHLHLSSSTAFNCKKMGGNRSSLLLFFITTVDSVYFLDVRTHPTKSGFSSFSFLEILEKNSWMRVAGFNKLENIINMKPIIKNDNDIYFCMNKHVNLAYEINNKFYSKTLGVTGYGNKIFHSMLLLEMKKYIEQFENIDLVSLCIYYLIRKQKHNEECIDIFKFIHKHL